MPRPRTREQDVVPLEPSHTVLDLQSPVPLYHQMATYFTNRIQSGQWQPGRYLPSEEELCSHFGVSRTVVRQAMALLVQKRLVTKKSGKRTMIAAPAYEGTLMQSLRGFYEDAIARGQRPYTRVLDLRVVPADPQVAGALAIKEGEPVVLLHRLRFLEGIPEVLVTTYLPEKICPGLTNEDFSNQSLYALLASRYGHVIARGIRSIEAVALSKAQAELLQVPVGSPALLLKSIGMLAEGTPIEYYVAFHRGDRARFVVQLVRNMEPPAPSADT
jgi:GntR family transcriptional regulator